MSHFARSAARHPIRAILPLLLAGALALAGCVATPSETATNASLDEADAGAAATRLVPLSYEGSTFTGFALCPGEGECTGMSLPQAQGGGDSWFPVELDGALQAAEITLTWDALTPATEELLLGIAYENQEGESDWIYAVGASPLTLSESGLDIPADKVRAVYVNAFRCQAGVLCVSAEQPFALEGTLTLTSVAEAAEEK